MVEPTSFFRLSYGVYIVTTLSGEKHNGCVANTVVQVAAEPAQLGVSISKDNYTCRMIEESGVFNATVLTEQFDMNLIAAFGFQSGKDVDKFDGFSFETDDRGVRYLTEHMAAMFSCRVISRLDLGSHVFFVDEVVEAQKLEGEPVMTYAYYHQVKKGTTPKNAPSYQKEIAVPGTGKKRFRCMFCGYIVEADSLPDDFTCPICGQGRDAFEEI